MKPARAVANNYLQIRVFFLVNLQVNTPRIGALTFHLDNVQFGLLLIKIVKKECVSIDWRLFFIILLNKMITFKLPMIAHFHK